MERRYGDLAGPVSLTVVLKRPLTAVAVLDERHNGSGGLVEAVDCAGRTRQDVNPGITTDDVLTLVSAMRGLIHTVPGATPDAWQRFLDLHLAGMTARS